MTATWPRTSASGSALRRSWPPSRASASSSVFGDRRMWPFTRIGPSSAVSLPWARPSGWSQMNASPSRARMPTSSAALAAASGSSAVPASMKQVVPLRIISRAASTTPRCSSSSFTVS